MKINYIREKVKIQHGVAEKLIGMIFKGTDIPELGNYPKKSGKGF